VLGTQDHSLGQGGHRGQCFVLKAITWDKVDIEVSAWSSRPSPGTRWTSRSVLGTQDHPLGQGGHRGQYLVLKAIPWDRLKGTQD